MLNAFGWVIFGMAVWGLCIVMQALQRRFAPEWADGPFDDGGMAPKRPNLASTSDAKDKEIAELKRRIETLEAIVTDRAYQWEQEYRRTD